MTRSRTKSFTMHGNDHEVFIDGSSSNTPVNVTTMSGSCTDEYTNPHGVNPFSCHLQDARGLAPLNGVCTDASYHHGSSYTDVHPGFPGGIGHLTSLPAVTAADYTSVMSRTNPSRAELVPLSLYQDMADLPRQLKDIKRLILTPKHHLLNAKEAANQSLAVKFGWLPFISDVKAIANFGFNVHRRAKELHSLYDKGGLRRRISLGSSHAVSSPSIQSIGGWTPFSPVNVRVTYSTTCERWGVVRWLPTTLPPFDPSDHGYFAEALKVASGFTPEGLNKGAWDLVPWSFLIDWFSNLGDYMQSYSNTVPASAPTCCVMTHTRTVATVVRTDATASISGGNGVTILDDKSRTIGGASLNVNLSFLTGDHLSILEALTIQRIHSGKSDLAPRVFGGPRW